MSQHNLAQPDRFAELLSQGLSMTEIRERMSLTNDQAQGIMRRIRQKLGPQAV